MMSPVDLPLLENPRYDFFLTLLGVFIIENKIFIINSFTQRKNMITQLRKENLIEAAEETSLNVYLRDEILNYIEKHKK